MIASASSRSPSRWSPFSITRTQKARSSASACATALITGSVSLRSRKSSPVFLPIAASRAAVIQQVIDDLEGDPKRVAVVAQRRDLRLGRARRSRRPPRSRPRTAPPSCRARPADRSARPSRRSCAAVSCSTSPSAIVAAAFARMSSTRRLPVSTISWKTARKQVIAHQHARTCCPTAGWPSAARAAAGFRPPRRHAAAWRCG